MFCKGNGRLIQTNQGRLEPLVECHTRVDRSWTAGGRDWLWGNSPNSRESREDGLEDILNGF